MARDESILEEAMARDESTLEEEHGARLIKFRRGVIFTLHQTGKQAQLSSTLNDIILAAVEA